MSLPKSNLLFVYKLAQELHKSVEEILELPAHEFVGWQQYFEIYPFTQDREDYRAAQIAMVIANMSGKTLKKPVSLDTFLPPFNSPSKLPKSREQLDTEKAAFKAKLKALQKR